MSTGRRGRPPLKEGEKSNKKPRSVRLSDEDWQLLKALGVAKWIERQLENVRKTTTSA